MFSSALAAGTSALMFHLARGTIVFGVGARLLGLVLLGLAVAGFALAFAWWRASAE
jgi:hypothetical protein